MDQTSLVRSEEIEGKVILALSRAGIPITAVDWSEVSQGDKFQLIVVTRLVNERGPRETYAQIFKALSAAGLYQSTLIRVLSVKSPEDAFAQRLVAELKRSVEGSIHITKEKERNGAPQYALVFSPYVGSGGAIPTRQVAGNADLRAFLEKRIGIDPDVVDQAITELSRSVRTTIPNVQLSLRRAKKLNLAA